MLPVVNGAVYVMSMRMLEEFAVLKYDQNSLHDMADNSLKLKMTR